MTQTGPASPQPIPEAAGRTRIGPPLAIAWGFGRYASICMVNAFALLVLYYLVSIVKLDPVLAGAMVFAARMFDIVASPLVGLASDSLRTPIGRRRPFLIAGGVLGALACYLIFHVPVFGGQAATATYVGGVLLIYTLAYATITIPHMAMPNEMTQDAGQRLSLMSYGAIFGTLGGLTVGAVGPYVIQHFGDGRRGYGAMSVMMAAAIFAAMVLCFVGTRKAPFVKERQPASRVFRGLRGMAANRPYVVLTGSHALSLILVAGQTSTILFFMRAIMKLPLSALAVGTVASTVAQFVAVPLWNRLARRIGVKRAFLAACSVGVLVAISWLFASSADTVVTFAIRYVAFGAMASGAMMLGLAMLTDTIAYDALMTGERREGLFSSVYSFTEKSAAAFGVLLTGALLSVGGYDKALDATQTQPAHAILSLYVGVGVLPAIGFLITIFMIARYYRLDEAMMARAAADPGEGAKPRSAPSEQPV